MPIIISCAAYGSKNKDKKEFTDKGIKFYHVPVKKDKRRK